PARLARMLQAGWRTRLAEDLTGVARPPGHAVRRRRSRFERLSGVHRRCAAPCGRCSGPSATDSPHLRAALDCAAPSASGLEAAPQVGSAMAGSTEGFFRETIVGVVERHEEAYVSR